MQGSASESKKGGLEDMSGVCRKSLGKVGDRVIEILQEEKDHEKIQDRKTDLWNFVAQFSKLNAESLHAIYMKSIKKKQQAEAGKRRKNDPKPSSERDPLSPEIEGSKSGSKKVRERVFDKKLKTVHRATIFARPARPHSPVGHNEARAKVFERPNRPFPKSGESSSSYRKSEKPEHKDVGYDDRTVGIDLHNESRHHDYDGRRDNVQGDRGWKHGRDHDDHYKDRERHHRDYEWHSRDEQKHWKQYRQPDIDKGNRTYQAHNTVSNFRDPRMCKSEQPGVGHSISHPQAQLFTRQGESHLIFPEPGECVNDEESSSSNSRSIDALVHMNIPNALIKNVEKMPFMQSSLETEAMESQDDPLPHGAIPIELEMPNVESFNNNQRMDFEVAVKTTDMINSDLNSWSQ